ncbi:MAG: hypothetical protein LBR06_07230 [Bacteroidales bacterium]|jgi:hypothetical protein|nr:hypothetical protein [Bacteroidales bacterium]
MLTILYSHMGAEGFERELKITETLSEGRYKSSRSITGKCPVGQPM